MKTDYDSEWEYRDSDKWMPFVIDNKSMFTQMNIVERCERGGRYINRHSNNEVEIACVGQRVICCYGASLPQIWMIQRRQ